MFGFHREATHLNFYSCTNTRVFKFKDEAIDRPFLFKNERR